MAVGCEQQNSCHRQTFSNRVVDYCAYNLFVCCFAYGVFVTLNSARTGLSQCAPNTLGELGRCNGSLFGDFVDESLRLGQRSYAYNKRSNCLLFFFLVRLQSHGNQTNAIFATICQIPSQFFSGIDKPNQQYQSIDADRAFIIGILHTRTQTAEIICRTKCFGVVPHR